MIEITDKEFNQLSAYIKKNYGINTKSEKRDLLTHRLCNLLIQNGYESYTEFYNALILDKTGKIALQLVDRITTNHTFFMREKDHFEIFKSTVLPYLENTVTSRDLRIWSAACSSGEEAYTLAMLIDEYFGKNKLFWDSKVLATDISDRVLFEALRGEYANEKLAPLPLMWRMNYFKKANENTSVIIDKIKSEVVFRKFNLMDDIYPFKKKFHVIFCRNVLIYFDNDTKIELIKKFYDNMEDGGYLFIGHTESIAKHESDFKYIMPAVYRKI